MKRKHRVFLYFSSWVLLAAICIVLNILNVDWEHTNIFIGVLVTFVLSIVQSSVLEFPLQTVATLIMGGHRRENNMCHWDHLTLVLNYNLLATCKDDIDECLETMYTAYIGNLCSNVSAVLVSATNDEGLKQYELDIRDKYRTIISDELYREGMAYADSNVENIDTMRLQNIWSKYNQMDKQVFKQEHLKTLCDRFASEFMVIHRVSRVLKKCGQYQDLMLLSEGKTTAFSYCDSEYYGKSARKFGERLFHESDDVNNIVSRHFDYTLVLDGDTGVPRCCVFELLSIAAAHPDKGIIQPSIKLHCTKNDTLYMHLESLRQSINEPFTNALTALFGQSAYFGKALIQNKPYISFVIGTEEQLLERVPVDVLSHDTFEAALMKPLYAGGVHLLEAPSYNYITWNIRERRWNRGEILLAMYFWKTAFGKPMRWLQRKLQKSKFNKTKLRTETKMDFVTSYIAHSALRHMLMKPLLMLFICLNFSVHLRYTYLSISIIMFLILIFPKFAVLTKGNYKFVLLETLASIVQYTPEAVVGCVRICRALYANISVNAKWIPQRAVEEQFKNSNQLVSSLKHLWGYSLFAVITGTLVVVFVPEAILFLFMLSTLIILPFYTGVTSMNIGFRRAKPSKQVSDDPESNADKESKYSDRSMPKTISSGYLYRSIGLLYNGFQYKDISLDSSSVNMSRNSSTDQLIDNTHNFGKKKFSPPEQNGPWTSYKAHFAVDFQIARAWRNAFSHSLYTRLNEESDVNKFKNTKNNMRHFRQNNIVLKENFNERPYFYKGKWSD